MNTDNPIDNQDDSEINKSQALSNNHNIDSIINSTQEPIKSSINSGGQHNGLYQSTLG